MEGREKIRIEVRVFFLILIEVSLFLCFILLAFDLSSAGIGQNTTVSTHLNIGNSVPEIVNISIYADIGSGIDLIPNSTREIVIEAIIRDYNGEGDVINSSMEFYDSVSSFFGDSDDNNDHYSNYSCILDYSYGDSTEVNSSCRFNVWYYANNASWNVTVFAQDNSSLTDYENRVTNVNTLLSVGLPDQIDYGLVNATNVSSERMVNITNFGNSRINISLEGYGYNRSDGLAMNCTLGAIKNISIGYEKYSLNSSNTSSLTLSEFEQIYTNLTNSSVVKTYRLNYRQNDTVNEALNASYWRIYVPAGVAGSCAGNIIFGATRAAGS